MYNHIVVVVYQTAHTGSGDAAATMIIAKEERSGGTVDWQFMLCTLHIM